MFNGGLRGKRATDASGMVTARDSFVQTQAPSITIIGYRITDTSFNTIDDTAVGSGSTVVLSGTGFVSNMTLTIAGIPIQPTLLSSTSLTFTAPALTSGTYPIFLSSTAGAAAILTPGLTFSGFPIWNASIYESNSLTVNVQLSVTGQSPFKFYMASNSSLPFGLSLSSSGLLSGTLNATVNTIYSFTVLVDDLQNQTTQQNITLSLVFIDAQFPSNVLLLTGEPTSTALITDSSSVASQLSVTANVSARPFSPMQGIGKYSLYCVNTGGYLTKNFYSAQSLPGDFTIEMWIVDSYYNAYSTPFSWRDGSTSAANGFLVHRANGTNNYEVTVGVGGVTYTITQTSGTFNSYAWHHLAVTRSGTTVTLWIDGISCGTTTVVGTITPPANAYIGVDYNNQVSSTAFVIAYVSNLRIVNGTALYTSTFTPSTTPLQVVPGTLLLTCNEGTFDMLSPSITVTNSVYFSPNNPFPSSTTALYDNTNEYSMRGKSGNDSDYFYITNANLGSTTNLYNLFAANADWTIEFWHFARSFSGSNTVNDLINLGFTTTLSGVNSFRLSTLGGNYKIIARDAANSTYILDATMATAATYGTTLGNWRHLALTRTSGTINFYVDGVKTTYSGTYTETPSVKFLAILTASGYGCDGYISNLRIIAGQAIYSANFTPSTSPLTTNTIGSTGGGAASTLTGTVALLTAQSNSTTDNSINNFVINAASTSNPWGARIEKFNPFISYSGKLTRTLSGLENSVYLNGSSSITIPASASLQLTGDFTIEAWVYPTTLSGQHTIIGSASTDGFGLYYITSSAVGLYVTINGTTQSFYTSSTLFLYTYSWMHVAVSRVGTSVQVFLNGNPTYATTTMAGQMFQSNNALQIGVTGASSSYFTGYISNLRIVNGTALYTKPFYPQTIPLTNVTNTVLLTLQNPGSTNNYDFIDSSPRQHTVLRGGNVLQGSYGPYGPNGWSTYFQGTDSGLTFPHSTNLDLTTGDFTIECWAYYKDPTAGQYLFNKSGSSGTNVGCYTIYMANTGQLAFATQNSNGATGGQAFTFGTVSRYAWHHYAVTRVGTTINTYLDGVLVTSATQTTAIQDRGGNFRIGNQDGGTGFAGGGFQGWISNLRIVKGYAVYTGSTFTPPKQKLTAITGTQLLACQDNRHNDNSPNKVVPTWTPAVGCPITSQFSPIASNQLYKPSVHGGSAYFDGSSDWINFDTVTNTAAGTGDFTIELWVYAINFNSSPNNVPFLYDGRPSGTEGPYHAICVSSTSLYLQYWVNTTAVIQAPSQSISAGSWFHIAVARSSGTTKMFLNGVQVGSSYVDSNNYLAANQRPYIGAMATSNGGDSFNGYISDVRYIKGKAMYTTTFTPPSTMLTSPSDSPASLLLNCNNGAVTDVRAFNLIDTFNGAQLVTSTKAYGSGSMSFVGSKSQYFRLNLQTASGDHGIGTNDFTIEFWIYNMTTTNRTVSYAASNTIMLWINTSNNLQYDNYGVSTILNSSATSSVVPLNTWTHCAVSRSNAFSRMFINGALVASGADTTNWNPASYLYIGTDAGSNYMTGYLDDLRITNGYARYTANFTPVPALTQ